MSDWNAVTFEETIAILVGWTGHVLRTSIENEMPVTYMSAAGIMRAGRDVGQHFDLDEYEFELDRRDNWTGFTLHRDYFLRGIFDDQTNLNGWLGSECREDTDVVPILWIVTWGLADATGEPTGPDS